MQAGAAQALDKYLKFFRIPVRRHGAPVFYGKIRVYLEDLLGVVLRFLELPEQYGALRQYVAFKVGLGTRF